MSSVMREKFKGGRAGASAARKYKKAENLSTFADRNRVCCLYLRS